MERRPSYYIIIPVFFSPDTYFPVFALCYFTLTTISFVPVAAIFPTLTLNNKEAAVSIQNLGVGLSSFGRTALVSLIYFVGKGDLSVFIIFGLLYYFAAILTYFTHLKQPRIHYYIDQGNAT